MVWGPTPDSTTTPQHPSHAVDAMYTHNPLISRLTAKKKTTGFWFIRTRLYINSVTTITIQIYTQTQCSILNESQVTWRRVCVTILKQIISCTHYYRSSLPRYSERKAHFDSKTDKEPCQHGPTIVFTVVLRSHEIEMVTYVSLAKRKFRFRLVSEAFGFQTSTLICFIVLVAICSGQER
jgi:hypothetical protein